MEICARGAAQIKLCQNNQAQNFIIDRACTHAFLFPGAKEKEKNGGENTDSERRTR